MQLLLSWSEWPRKQPLVMRTVRQADSTTKTNHLKMDRQLLVLVIRPDLYETAHHLITPRLPTTTHADVFFVVI